MIAVNVLAGLAVDDLVQALPWYETLLGVAGSRPMPALAEWSFPRGGGLQVFEDPLRAGKGSITLVVEDLDDQLNALRDAGVDAHSRTDSDDVKTARIDDPAGTQIVLAQAKKSTLIG